MEKKRLWALKVAWMAGIVLLVSSCIVLANPSLDEAVETISNQIAAFAQKNGYQAIAIMDFTDLRGESTELGRYVAEEVSTKLLMDGTCQVIDRQYVTHTARELGVNAAGFIPPDSAKKLATTVNADLICIGTAALFGDLVKINPKLISGDTGSFVFATSVRARKDQMVSSLLGETSSASGQSPVASQADSQPPARQSETAVRPRSSSATYQMEPGSRFYYEDFSSVDIGMIPEDWDGGSGLAVVNNPKTGRKVLVPYQKQKSEYVAYIPGIEFPENWSLEVEAVIFAADLGSFDFMLGSWGVHLFVSSGPVLDWSGQWVQDASGRMSIMVEADETANTSPGNFSHVELVGTPLDDFPIGRPFTLKIQKKGRVVMVFLDNKRITFARMEDLAAPIDITFKSRRTAWEIRRIEGEVLP